MSRRKKPRHKRKREVDMGTPIEEVTKDTGGVFRRRHLIGAGILTLGGITAWRAGLFKAFENETQPEVGPREVEVVTPYEKWANKIVLPEYTVGDDGIDLQKHYGATIDSAGLARFKADFLEYLEQLKAKIEEAKENSEKSEALGQFIRQTMSSFEKHGSIEWPKIDKRSQNSSDYQIAHILNRALAQIGYLAEVYPAFSIEKIEKVKKIAIVAQGMELTAPLFVMSKEKPFDAFPRKRTAGEFLALEQAVVFRPAEAKEKMKSDILEYREVCKLEGIQPKLGDAESEVFSLYILAHEVGHTTLDKMLLKKGIKSVDSGNTALRHRKVIPMRGYNYEPEIYGKFDNVNVHELFATGEGLRKSGDAAFVYTQMALMTAADQGGGRNYILATDALMQEIVNSPKVNPVLREELRRSIGLGSMKIGRLMLAAHSLSKTDIHEIGERMSKLAIRLTQP